MDKKTPAAEELHINRITLKTVDDEILTGCIHIAVRNRVSEVFTRGEEPFIVLFDVERKEEHVPVMFINKAHIIWVEPEEE